MKNRKPKASGDGSLRQQAEKRLKKKQSQAHPVPVERDARKLLHELQVHQVELEMQNKELLQSRQELEESLAQYAGLYDFAPVGYYTLDGDGTILKVNLAGAGLLDLERARLIGKRFDAFLSLESRPDFSAFIDKVCTNDDGADCELVLDASPDGPRYLHIEGRPVCSEEDADKQCRVVAMDITARKRTEKALLESRERLRQAEKMTAIGQLAGGVAHDFNNQLTSIMGNADMLAERLEEGELKRQAQNIVVSARRAADLTQQLLAFSRKGKYLSVPVPVHALLCDMASMLGRSIDKRIHITQLLKADQSVIVGDPNQLQNALLNVALNARDAMPQGGEVTFETDVTNLGKEYCQDSPYEIAPGPYLRISISDTGCGMTDEVKMRLFEPFFTTKSPGQGTGMGLACVYGTVRNHHGAISVRSESARGTTFCIYLPLAPDAVPLTPDNLDAPPSRGSARILIVDDEAVVLEVMEEMLQDLGYVVVSCANGREAVAYYRANLKQVDLVILDLVMPDMSGRDVFIAMRQINPQVRVLLSSGYSLDGEAQGILNEGALGFIGKPFRAAELARIIAETLARV